MEDFDVLDTLDTGDDEAGALSFQPDLGVYNEAGFLEFIIPAAIANEMKKKGQKIPVKPGSKAKPMPTQSGNSLAGILTKNKQQDASISKLARSLADLKASLGLIAKGPRGEGAEPGTGNGARMLIGSELAVAAPAAAGPDAWGPLVVRPVNAVRISTIVIYVVEDTYAALAANQTSIGPYAPFWVDALTLAGDNIIRSETPALPGPLFAVEGQNYGFPIGTNRTGVGLPTSSPLSVEGFWSPRASAGANGAMVIASALAPSFAN